MNKFVIFGNSGAGKSTLAKTLANKYQLAHLDLDTIAWQATSPPQRLATSVSAQAINDFLNNHKGWVIEGCYADLLELVTPKAEEIIFLNLSVDDCIENAKNRPWEPHKYESKAAQDANLDILIEWISQYTERNDTFSKRAHQQLFESFAGKKTLIVSNQHYT